MRVSKYEKYIGMETLYTADSMDFGVKILDVKFAFGNVRFLITPVCGRYQKWVDSTKVDMEAMDNIQQLKN